VGVAAVSEPKSELRPKPDGLVEVLDRPIDEALGPVDQSPIVEGRDMVGLEANRYAVALDGRQSGVCLNCVLSP